MQEIITVILNTANAAAIVSASAAAISAFAALIGAVGVIIVLLNNARAARRKQRKLANAIRHHMDVTEKSLEMMLAEEKITALKKKIKSEAGYMPYAPLSNWDELTYDQAIEALTKVGGIMRKEKRKREEILLSYFHNHQTLHAVAESFSLDFVRASSQKRRLLFLETFKQYGEATLCYVKKARKKKMFGLREQRSGNKQQSDDH